MNEEARCTALGMPYANGKCGYENDSGASVIINEGGECHATNSGGCNGVIVNEGGVCEGTNDGCRNSKVYEGGTCLASGGRASCYNSKIYKGGTCENAEGASLGCFGATVYEGGTCINCQADSIMDGGVCIATRPGFCQNREGAPYRIFYRNGGCCEDYGKGYCPTEHRCNN